MAPQSEFTYKRRDEILHIEDLTRREFMFGALGAALLIACGDDDEEISGPRVVEDYFGPVSIAAQPERIVAGDELTLGNLLALGIQPIAGVYFTASLASHLREHLQNELPNVALNEEEIDLEKVLSLDPDLLITVGAWLGDPYNEEACNRYKAAVTTFCYEFGDVYEEHLKQNVIELGRALNLVEEADKLLSRYDERIAELRQKVLDAGYDTKPVSVVRVRALDDYSIRVGTTESIIFRAIGIPQPEGQQDPDEFAINISAEQLGMLNDSHTLVVYNLAEGLTEATIRESDIWQSLTPVKEGRIVFVEPAVWYSNDILGAFAIMNDIENLLLPLARE